MTDEEIKAIQDQYDQISMGTMTPDQMYCNIAGLGAVFLDKSGLVTVNGEMATVEQRRAIHEFFGDKEWIGL